MGMGPKQVLLDAAHHRQVQSLQATFGTFESIVRSSQHKQDLTEKAVKQGESEINRISEVLQKLQNEILKDLSDGIHVVKDARERDFTSLENTVEERLTELTKSINDNIAIFTEVQKRSQKEINDVKTKVASLEDSKGYKQDLRALKEVVEEIQTSVKSREKDIEALRSTVQTMESDVYTEVKELVSLKQEQQRFKEAADSEHLTLQALTEKILQAEETASRLPEEIRRLEEELRQLKAAALGPEEDGAFRASEAFETLQKESQGLDLRLQSVEDGVESDLKMLRTAVDSLVAYSVKIETNENNLESAKGLLEDLRNDLDRLFVKVEKIQEKV
ncbi:cytoskeleton-associated protein 4 isoform 2 [Camelus ferus]|nr:cytoskeleton-associated protein 4 isoform 2 [Camelus ferus]